jgi:hypothetical protein
VLFDLQIENASLSSASFNNVCVFKNLMYVWFDIGTHECMLIMLNDLELLHMSCVLLIMLMLWNCYT